MHTPARKTFLVFGNPIIEEEEINEVVACLRSGWISTGPRVARFERLFRDYIGCKHARALASCTAGLHLSMLVAGIKPGDEIITTPMTFCATANVITHVGATPVFADIDRSTMTIDPDEVKKKITPKTRAIIPVHFAGRPCEMDELMALARRHNLVVIEDAAHAIEAVYKGKKIGAIGDLTCFSFYATKNIVTAEGGMVTTNNDEWADKIEMYGLHGLNKGAWQRYSDAGFQHYQVIYPGYKYNMTDLQASLGIHQLPRIGRYLKRREEIWKRYDEAFQELPVFTPPAPAPHTVHARHLYTLLIDIDSLGKSRDEIQNALQQENIGTGIHFIALHLHKYYGDRFGYKRGDFPNAEYISDRTLSIPLSAKLSDQDVEDVITAVRKVVT
jgi:dTDP-4-amino-4,6-dideoxygalactose transaminase